MREKSIQVPGAVRDLEARAVAGRWITVAVTFGIKDCPGVECGDNTTGRSGVWRQTWGSDQI